MYNSEVSLSTISRVLQRAKWSRKAVQARAAERSELLRRAWQAIQKEFSIDQLLILDESAANEKTGDRKYGSSPQGLTCGVSQPVKRSERWSILPVLGESGYLDYTIWQGAITTEIFLVFIAGDLGAVTSAP